MIIKANSFSSVECWSRSLSRSRSWFWWKNFSVFSKWFSSHSYWGVSSFRSECWSMNLE